MRARREKGAGEEGKSREEKHQGRGARNEIEAVQVKG